MTIRIYRRVSTDRQDLDAQDHGIEGYLKENHIYGAFFLNSQPSVVIPFYH